MVSPRERTRPGRRRIAGERHRPSGATASHPAPPGHPGHQAEPIQPTEAVEATETTEPYGATEADGPTENRVSDAPGEADEAAETHVTRALAEPTDTATGQEAPPAATLRRGGPPTWVVTVLAGLLVVALALDGFVAWREVSHRTAEEQAARGLHSALTQAPPVAQKAAGALLSYRYDSMDKNLADADKYLTDKYAPKYKESIRLVSGPSADVRATVKAKVLSSGVVEASGRRADVLLFVNQTTTSPTRETQTALNRVVFTMVRREGGWRVDEIKAF